MRVTVKTGPRSYVTLGLFTLILFFPFIVMGWICFLVLKLIVLVFAGAAWLVCVTVALIGKAFGHRNHHQVVR